MSSPENSSLHPDQEFKPSVPDLSSLVHQGSTIPDEAQVKGREVVDHKGYAYSPQAPHSAEYVEKAKKALLSNAEFRRISYERKERVQRVERPNIDEALSFIHRFGLNTKPVYFLEEFDGKYADLEGKIQGRYDSRADAVVIKLDAPDDRVKSGREKDYHTQLQGLVVHELAHSSSAYQNYFSIDHDYMVQDTVRIGNAIESAHGNALEEAFCEHMAQRYYTESDYDPGIGPRYGTPEAGAFGDALVISIEGGSVTINIEGAPPLGLKNIIKHLKQSRISGRVGYIDRRLLDNEGERGTLRGEDIGVHNYAFLAQALSFLVEDDPTLFDAFILSRSNVEGLRQIAQKLNALEPGLYKRLRDIRDTDTASAIQFQQIVVDALYAKYFPEKAAVGAPAAE